MTGAGLEIAVIGAGAVAEKRYLPAARDVEDLTVTHLVDLDLERARRLASGHGVPHVARQFEEVLGEVDAVVVATPPASHRPITTACLERGVHVLCEKPLAPDPEDGEAMVAAAEASDAILSVGMIRRQGRSVRLLRRCVELGMPGEVRRVDAEEGGEFGWPLRTGHIFDAGQGGVLRDTGTHLLDLLFWTVDAGSAEVSAYRDDSLGGPEANARVELEMEVDQGTVAGSVEVSFTRPLDNRIRVHGSTGVLEAHTLGGAEVVFRPAGGGERVRLVPGDAADRSRVEDFAGQLREFVSAIREGGPAPVPASSALLPVEVIHESHRVREPRLQPWEVPPGGGTAPALDRAVPADV